MKRLTLLLGIALLTSCGIEDKMKQSEELSNTIHNKQVELSKIQQKVHLEEKKSAVYLERIKESGLILEGKQPIYSLTLKLKQSRMSLDIMKHAKDAMNAITFNIPVSKEFYDEVKVGTKLTDDFRMGSFIMNGTFSDWNVKIIKKEMY